MAYRLSDEMLENVSGGVDNNDKTWRTESGTVMSMALTGNNDFFVKTEACGQVVAHYDGDMSAMKPGTRVEVALMGTGSWQIVQLL